VNAVKAAVAAGYRHFDCAYIYHNEQHIGRALREAIADSNGQLKREDFFIVSKCWNNYHAKDKVKKSIQDCLARFGFDYLDLYLIHWPMGFVVRYKNLIITKLKKKSFTKLFLNKGRR
jgi:diketogulonate reductase-like aldo/keto reductase